MSKEIKDMVKDKGTEAVINLAIEGFKSVFTGNEEHKKIINNRNEYEKQLEEDKKKAKKDLDDLYEKKKKEPENDFSKEILGATEFYDYKKKMYDDHVQETTNLNQKEGSDPDRNSRDIILGSALGGALGGVMYHYLKDGGKNLKIK